MSIGFSSGYYHFSNRHICDTISLAIVRAMQVIILCGGKGTRIREVSESAIPKPMVTVGSHPILWHIMRRYASFGHSDFILCLGYKSWNIKEYFLNFQAMSADMTVELGRRNAAFHTTFHEAGWRVTLAETGLETMTAGRIQRVGQYINGKDVFLTYGDGLSNVNIDHLLEFHQQHGRSITVTGVLPPGRFGEMLISGESVIEMREKPTDSSRYINGGFMVIKKHFLDNYLTGDMDDVMLERLPLERAARDGEMMIWKHHGFWQCMDTYRDWELLNQLWAEGQAPWKL